MIPKRREDLEWFARLVADVCRFEEQCARKGTRVALIFGQRGLDARVAPDDGGVAQAIPINRPRAGFLDQQVKFGKAVVRLADDKMRSHVFKGRSQRRKRMVQPPARRRARLPWAFLLWRPDEDGNDGSTACRCFGKRRIVGKPQVATKPDDGGADVGHALE